MNNSFSRRASAPLSACLLSVLAAACGAPSTADEGTSVSLALCPSNIRFQDYCENADSLPASTKATVDALLAKAQTRDCAAAQAKLEGLTSLAFSDFGPRVGDLAPLATLSNLTSLVLAGQKLEDLRPLSRLVNLESLDISDNDVTTPDRRFEPCPLQHPDTDHFGPLARIDIRPLAHLRRLTDLTLRSDIVHSLRPLARLEKLRTLDVDCLDFDGNLAPLARLPELESMDLSHASVHDLSPIPSFAKSGAGLSLQLDVCPIESLRPIALLTALVLQGDLESVQAVRDEEHCPTVLSGMRRDIKSACLARNGATPATAAVWLSGILGRNVTEEEARTMTELDLSGHLLDAIDVPFLQGFPALEVLDLSHTTFTPVDDGAPSFVQLVLADLGVGAPFPKVRELRFRDAMLDDIFALNPLPFIQSLDLRDNLFTQVGDLARMFPKANELLLEGNPINKDQFSCPTKSRLAALNAFCTSYLATP